MNASLRVAYDGRLAIEPFRGMGRYLRTLIAGRENALLGFCASGESSKSLPLIEGGFRFYPVWEQWSLPKLIAKYGVTTFIAPYNTAPLRLPPNVRLVLIVHDLIYMEPSPLSRSTYQNIGRLYRKTVVPKAVHKASQIITVSEYTKSQLVQRLAIAPEHVQVIPCSLGPEWFGTSSLLDNKEHLIFMVSGEAPSKNLSRGIEAFARLIQLTGDRRIVLKVAGVKEKYHLAFKRAAEHLGAGGQVELLGYLPDESLRNLYRRSKLFVMPSLSEGFGIPVLEAMASGAPMALSSRGSLPEVAGGAAHYFDPFSVEDMALKMRQMLESSSMRAAHSATGDMQVRKFHQEAVQPIIDSFWNSLDFSASD